MINLSSKDVIYSIPSERVVSISKLVRIVDCFAKRLLIQERLTEQISRVLEQVLAPKGVMVMVEGQHLCMQMRGIQKPGCSMISSFLRGNLKKQKAKLEFLLLKK